MTKASMRIIAFAAMLIPVCASAAILYWVKAPTIITVFEIGQNPRQYDNKHVSIVRMIIWGAKGDMGFGIMEGRSMKLSDSTIGIPLKDLSGPIIERIRRDCGMMQNINDICRFDVEGDVSVSPDGYVFMMDPIITPPSPKQ